MISSFILLLKHSTIAKRKIKQGKQKICVKEKGNRANKDVMQLKRKHTNTQKKTPTIRKTYQLFKINTFNPHCI